jgi:hypothetical protein
MAKRNINVKAVTKQGGGLERGWKERLQRLTTYLRILSRKEKRDEHKN